ncbi:TPA: hypothetical protein I7730_00560 [Vibrio vulnificus]|uniref:DUF4870 domain-containing protein n=1 Tax=Vibrio vulnificus TaxID=672 RepID=A0A8H9MZ51_VIBVL|nr:hypothetical protein [Vibrio vulnificus]
MNETREDIIEKQKSNLMWLTYALWTLGTFLTFGVLSLSALIIGFMCRKDSATEFERSHYRFIARSIAYGYLWGFLLIFGLIIPIFGQIAYLFLFIWIVYRNIKGLIYFSKGRCMYI